SHVRATCCHMFSGSCARPRRALHSLPTRRSSDLFSSTSSRTTSARTSLQTFAAQRDNVALSSPQGETIPPVRTFESRKRRILRCPVTSRDSFENGAGRRWLVSSFRSGARKRDCGPRGVSQGGRPASILRQSNLSLLAGTVVQSAAVPAQG